MPKKSDKKKTPLEQFREVFESVPNPKGGLPTMPTRISDAASDQLGDMIARYSAWREFTEDRHTEACAIYAQCKSEYDLAVDRLIVGANGKSVSEKKAVAKATKSVEPLFKAMTEAEMYRDLLAGKLESFSNVLAMLSRELTRRGIYDR